MGNLDHTGRLSKSADQAGKILRQRRMDLLLHTAEDLSSMLQNSSLIDETQVTRAITNLNILFFGEYVSAVDHGREAQFNRPAPGVASISADWPSRGRIHPLAKNRKAVLFIKKLVELENVTVSHDEMCEYLGSNKETVRVYAFQARKLLSDAGFPDAFRTIYKTGFRIDARYLRLIRFRLKSFSDNPWVETPEPEVLNEPLVASPVSAEKLRCACSLEALAPNSRAFPEDALLSQLTQI